MADCASWILCATLVEMEHKEKPYAENHPVFMV